MLTYILIYDNNEHNKPMSSFASLPRHVDNGDISGYENFQRLASETHSHVQEVIMRCMIMPVCLFVYML